MQATERETKTISIMDFILLFAATRGAEMLSLVAVTTQRLRRTANDDGQRNPYGKDDVQKTAKISGVINWIYEKSVNRQRGREGKEDDFKAKARQWGQHLSGWPFIVHVGKDGKAKIYLQVKVEHIESTYVDLATGQAIPEETVARFKQAKSDRQEVDKTILLSDYELCKIQRLNMRGVTYILTD